MGLELGGEGRTGDGDVGVLGVWLAVELEAIVVIRWPRVWAWGEKKEGLGLTPGALGEEEELEKALEQEGQGR